MTLPQGLQDRVEAAAVHGDDGAELGLLLGDQVFESALVDVDSLVACLLYDELQGQLMCFST